MRAAIVRWISLAQRETQNYESLMEHGWELLGVGARRPDHDLKAIRFPVVAPNSLDYVALQVPGLDWAFKKFAHLEIHNLNYMFGLKQYLKNMDIVDLSETYHPFCYQVAQMKKECGFKLVVSVAENIPFTHERPGFRRRTKDMVFQNADYYFALSEAAKQTLVLEGAKADRIAIIPSMGIDTTRFSPADKDTEWLSKLGLTRDDIVILFVGRLVWSKGIFDLLYAMKMLKLDSELQQRPIKLLVVGNGEEWNTMNERIDRLQLRDCVRLVQRVPYADMPKIHNLADIFVLPSITTPKWQEQFGAVLAESMASAKPVLGASSGAIPEVIADAGLIAQANDYLSLAQQLKKLILDEHLREDLGKKGRQRATQEYDSKVIGEKIRKIYESIV